MSPSPSPAPRRPIVTRVCARVGCDARVKKATAKYCSRPCCATDPARLSLLRERSRMASQRPLHMSRQLSIPFGSGSGDEQILDRLCAGREDAPLGMSRLVV